MRVTIEEYEPEELKPFMMIPGSNPNGSLWFDDFYDVKRKLHFYVMKEPEWLKFDFYKTYEIKITDDIDEDTSLVDACKMYMRLAVRLNNDIVIISYCSKNNKWSTTDPIAISPLTEKIDIFKYADKFEKRCYTFDHSIKHMKGETEDDV